MVAIKKRNNIGIILARGNSKRIPKKALTLLNGKPLISWIIESALNSSSLDELFVSTDCQDIAQTAVLYGAKVPFLRDQYCDDFSTAAQATWYTTQVLKEKYGYEAKNIVQFMANCPFLEKSTIKNALNFFKKTKSTSLVSCSKIYGLNPWWSLTLNENFQGNFILKDKIEKWSQDLGEAYIPTGSIWISTSKNLLEKKSFYRDNTTFFPIEYVEAIDIDTPEDLAFAEKISFTINHSKKELITNLKGKLDSHYVG